LGFSGAEEAEEDDAEGQADDEAFEVDSEFHFMSLS
jgi:hypothetical protein